MPQTLSHAEVGRILAAVRNPRHRGCFSLIYGCGLRISEAAALPVTAIDKTSGVLRVTPAPRRRRADARIARPATSRCCAGCRLPGHKLRDDHHAAGAHTSQPLPPLRRSVARAVALARRHPTIIANRPTAAAAAANRLTLASHHHAHATFNLPTGSC